MSQQHRGQGDADAARIYAEALGKAPEFYRFCGRMEATRKFVKPGTTMVLPANSELFGLLYDSHHYDQRRRAGDRRRASRGGDADALTIATEPHQRPEFGNRTKKGELSNVRFTADP